MRLFASMLLLACSLSIGQPAAAAAGEPQGSAAEAGEPAQRLQTFSAAELIAAAGEAFAGVSEGLAKAIGKALEDYGEPVAYILGEEAGGAIGLGLKYGKGQLRFKQGKPRTVFWQGPSLGFDVGGDASKVFTLVYGLSDAESLFRRFPAVDGSYYFVAGVGMNYQRADSITLVPIRTGVGIRAGASIGYQKYSAKRAWMPL